MNNLYLLSRKIHRILILLIIMSTLIMAFTGMILKNPGIGQTLGLNSSLIRYLHNNFSLVFVSILSMMMVTGLVMYLFPYFKRSSKS